MDLEREIDKIAGGVGEEYGVSGASKGAREVHTGDKDAFMHTRGVPQVSTRQHRALCVTWRRQAVST